MPGLTLVPVDAALAAALAGGDPAGILSVPDAGAVATLVRLAGAAYLEQYRESGARPPWIGYLAQDAGTSGIVGTCGFKGACRHRTVEIAYFTFPGFEGRGWGRAMAAALVGIAWRSPAIDGIRAHTLPARSASTSILLRLGFRMLGAVHDPDDGVVHRWTLHRPGSAPRNAALGSRLGGAAALDDAL